MKSFVDGQGEPGSQNAASVAFASTAPNLVTSIRKKYDGAIRQGCEVVEVILECSGGLHIHGQRLLSRASLRAHGRAMLKDDPNAPWSAPTLRPYTLQAMSVALHSSIFDSVSKQADGQRNA